MRKYLKASLATFAFFSMNSLAFSQEAVFLKSVAGNWTGNGTVKVKTDSSPIDVTCTFKSGSTEASLRLDGNCRGLLIVSRDISADLKVNGGRYSGSYIGAGTGTAGLSGKRNGDTIALSIKWAKEVNGDRSAQMSIEKLGENGMRLTTVDTDAETGQNVVTSQINLRRE